MNYSDLFLEGYYDALEEMEDLFLEGYIDAINEGSTTAKYLNHHSLGGTFFGPALFRWFNSELKKGDSFMGVHKLYPSYLKYCAKRGYSALSKEEFIEEGKKYYALKAKVDLNQFGGVLAGNTLGYIGGGIAQAGATRAVATGGVLGGAGIAGGGAVAALGGLANTAGLIGSEVYRRRPEFVDKANMRHDIKGI